MINSPNGKWYYAAIKIVESVILGENPFNLQERGLLPALANGLKYKDSDTDQIIYSLCLNWLIIQPEKIEYFLDLDFFKFSLE